MPEQWLTMEQAAKRLNRSPRTLEKWIQRGRLKGRLADTGEGRHERVFEASHVEKVAQSTQEYEQKTGRPAPLAATQELTSTTHTTADAGNAAELLAVKELLGMVRQLTDRLLEPPYRRNDWLTPRECFLGWGMPARLASELAARGLIAGEPYGKSWRIRRDSLEAYKRG